MFQCCSDSFLHNGSDLELYGGRIPGQQQSVQHIQELHCQQLKHSNIYSPTPERQAARIIIPTQSESHTHTSHLALMGQ